MRPRSFRFIHAVSSLPMVVAALAFLASPAGNAVAGDSLGLYIGGAIGQSRIVEAMQVPCGCDIDPGALITHRFDKTHLAFQGELGARPIPLLGAEIDYIDLGKANSQAYSFPESASIKGEAVFGLLYLPVPVVEVYLKAGVARLEGALRFSSCGPCACNQCLYSSEPERTNTSGAGGIGVQYSFRSWSVRAEYERFNAAGADPSLLSAGITWSFL